MLMVALLIRVDITICVREYFIFFHLPCELTADQQAGNQCLKALKGPLRG